MIRHFVAIQRPGRSWSVRGTFHRLIAGRSGMILSKTITDACAQLVCDFSVLGEGDVSQAVVGWWLRLEVSKGERLETQTIEKSAMERIHQKSSDYFRQPAEDVRRACSGGMVFYCNNTIHMAYRWCDFADLAGSTDHYVGFTLLHHGTDQCMENHQEGSL